MTRLISFDRIVRVDRRIGLQLGQLEQYRRWPGWRRWLRSPCYSARSFGPRTGFRTSPRTTLATWALARVRVRAGQLLRPDAGGRRRERAVRALLRRGRRGRRRRRLRLYLPQQRRGDRGGVLAKATDRRGMIEALVGYASRHQSVPGRDRCRQSCRRAAAGLPRGTDWVRPIGRPRSWVKVYPQAHLAAEARPNLTIVRASSWRPTPPMASRWPRCCRGKALLRHRRNPATEPITGIGSNGYGIGADGSQTDTASCSATRTFRGRRQPSVLRAAPDDPEYEFDVMGAGHHRTPARPRRLQSRTLRGRTR